MKRDTFIGILLCSLAPAVVAAGGVYLWHRSAAPSISASDVAAVDKLLSSPQVAATGLKPGRPRLVESVTQGDDTMDIVRVDGDNKDGPLTIYLAVENGKVVNTTYAQNGSAK